MRLRPLFHTTSLASRSLFPLIGLLAGLWMTPSSAQSPTQDTALHTRLTPKVAVVETLGFTPSLVAEINEQAAQDISNELLQQRETAWVNSGAFDPFKRSLQINPAARLLRRFLDANDAYVHAVLIDHRGALVAAVPSSPNYDFSNDLPWQQAFREGVGNNFIGTFTAADGVSTGEAVIAVPVRDRNRDNQTIGVLMMRISENYLRGSL